MKMSTVSSQTLLKTNNESYNLHVKNTKIHENMSLIALSKGFTFFCSEPMWTFNGSMCSYCYK